MALKAHPMKTGYPFAVAIIVLIHLTLLGTA
jgi:hypothetical protein